MSDDPCQRADTLLGLLGIGDVGEFGVHRVDELVGVHRHGHAVFARIKSDPPAAKSFIGDHRPCPGRAERRDGAALIPGSMDRNTTLRGIDERMPCLQR